MTEILTEFREPRPIRRQRSGARSRLLPIMSAVANAVYNAVGCGSNEVPIAPPKILKALAEKKVGRTPRYGPTGFPEVHWPGALGVCLPSGWVCEQRVFTLVTYVLWELRGDDMRAERRQRINGIEHVALRFELQSRNSNTAVMDAIAAVH